MISIVVPTLNERARITGLLESLSALPGEKEIVVADGGSTDGTAEAAEASAFSGRVRIVRCGRGRTQRSDRKSVV